MTVITVPTPTPATAVCGYRLVLPPGWERIPLREGTDDAIHRIVRRAFGGVHDGARGDRVARARVQAEGRLRELAGRARREGAGLDLYLPVRARGGSPVPASFVVSEFELPGRGQGMEGREGTEVAAPSGQPVTVDGAKGVRRTARLDESWRVDYVLPVPRGRGHWLTVAFAAPTAEGDLGDVLVELFDAVMGTFRWGWEQEIHREKPPRVADRR